MTLVEYATRDQMYDGVADLCAGALGGALSGQETASFAVPGGTTPAPIFDRLSKVDLPWARITVMPTDERQVPPDHVRSNAKLIREHLLVGSATEAAFMPLFDDGSIVSETALLPHLPLDLLLLGMGADMHTASLFPGADALATALADTAPPVLEIAAPGAPEPRGTLTAPVLRAAARIHVVITGEEKREALEKAMTSDPLTAPVSIILDTATVHWSP